ncbi:MAG: major facilitator family transporter [Myxococcales bacterium]|nr:major facilitator family transporter [Myxococcales bacterium]
MSTPPGPERRAADSLRRPGRILGVLALTNIVGYAARNGLFTVYPDLRDRFGLHDARLGLLTTAFIVPHALATLPFGWAGDRYDRRRVIAFGLILASIAGALGALATEAWMLTLSRAVVGFGTAAIVPAANSILGQLYDGPKKASRMSIFNLGLLFGGMLGFGVGLWAHFPGVVVILSIPCAVLALVILMLPVPPVPSPRESLRMTRYLFELGKPFLVEGRELLKIRTLRWMVLSTTAMAFAAGGYNAWLIDFLERDKHMSKGDATTLLTVAMTGAVAGIVIGGRISDRLHRARTEGRLWTIVIGMAATIPCAIACVMLPPGPLLYAGGITTMFFISWYHAPMAVSVDDLAPPGRAVAAQGLVIFTMHLFGTASASYLIGVVSDHSSLYAAMWVPTGMLAVALIGMLIATPSFARDHARARG